MFKKCILILAASCMMYSCATQTESNPFLTEFQTPNGVPPFDKIKLEHYEPAFQKGIEEQNANIQAIIANTEAPTFENVVVALDNSSPTLDRVGGVFFNLTEAETTDELTALSMKLAPTLAEHEDNISLNQELFKKIDAVYNQKDALGLTREQQRLLEKTYKGFVRSGANLPADKQARLREINKQLSTLGITFSNNILNENNDFKLYVEKEEDLIDCPPPSLSLLTLNALTASDRLIIPVQAQFLAMRGMAKLMQVVHKVQQRLNSDLSIAGVLITQYDGRKNLNKSVSELVQETFQGKVFSTHIRNSIALAEAPTQGQDIFHYAPKSAGAEDYEKVCNELLTEIK